MTDSAKLKLRNMLERFVRGDDRSIRFANEIEQYLDDNFRGTRLHEELIEPLATYRPGGGEFLVNENELVQQFEYAITQLKRSRTAKGCLCGESEFFE
ncbi:MAG: hypothetical protein JO020_16760 [Chloroflexi bacterium]|nr:hypothetical protein [Chloroflexota bacterium]MBV9895818.1 hypothetical protein [Chloroflexota bacterium]